VLFNEDCLQTSKRIASNSVDLIYVDPPYFSGRLYKNKRLGFDDRWKGLSEYLDWIALRLTAFKRILRDTGTIYIHADWHASHYLKVLADSIFGYDNFINEIVWKRQSAHNDTRQGSRHLGRVHDTLLVYALSENYIWNQQYVSYDESYLNRAYRHVEPGTSRRYALGDLTAPGGAMNGNARYEFMGVERYWRYSRSRMMNLFASGRVSTKYRVPLLKRYLDEMPGKPVQDVWTDIKPVTTSRESLRFPTQKPESLLARITLTSTDDGQLVYDPFAGSGTSGAVCFELSRRWIGSEISVHACRLIANRFATMKCIVSPRNPTNVLAQVKLPR